jgi:LysM repeat protein
MLAVAVVAPPSSSSSAALSARASATSRGDVVVVAATRRATATATLPRRDGVVRRTVPRRALVVVANVRPYTVRKGDTLASIASKRGMSVEEVKRNNKSRSPSADAEVKPGETILLPAGKLSKRDSEIIAGITKINQPREYPTRKGETIGEIIGQRGISFEDVQRLNPGVNLGTFNAGERLKLPPGKYTTREKEMLQGERSSVVETVPRATPFARRASFLEDIFRFASRAARHRTFVRYDTCYYHPPIT